jgi:hypothetical protein
MARNDIPQSMGDSEGVHEAARSTIAIYSAEITAFINAKTLVEIPFEPRMRIDIPDKTQIEIATFDITVPEFPYDIFTGCELTMVNPDHTPSLSDDHTAENSLTSFCNGDIPEYKIRVYAPPFSTLNITSKVLTNLEYLQTFEKALDIYESIDPKTRKTADENTRKAVLMPFAAALIALRSLVQESGQSSKLQTELHRILKSSRNKSEQEMLTILLTSNRLRNELISDLQYSLTTAYVQMNNQSIEAALSFRYDVNIENPLASGDAVRIPRGFAVFNSFEGYLLKVITDNSGRLKLTKIDLKQLNLNLHGDIKISSFKDSIILTTDSELVQLQLQDNSTVIGGVHKFIKQRDKYQISSDQSRIVIPINTDRCNILKTDSPFGVEARMVISSYVNSTFTPTVSADYKLYIIPLNRVDSFEDNILDSISNADIFIPRIDPQDVIEFHNSPPRGLIGGFKISMLYFKIAKTNNSSQQSWDFRLLVCNDAGDIEIRDIGIVPIRSSDQALLPSAKFKVEDGSVIITYNTNTTSHSKSIPLADFS